MINLGPIIFGLVFGFVIGFRLRYTEYFTNSSLIVMFIILVLVGCLEGAFPYYTDFSFSTGFIAAAIALVLSKLIFGRKRNTN